ncbi:MAG: hypothetical protein AAF288_00255 [Planctomycetota bacterium]
MGDRRRFPLLKVLTLTVALPVGAMLGLGLYKGGRSAVEAEVYRDRLVEMNQRYGDLAERYTRVVKRSAVTELDVTPDSVEVVFRTPQGELSRAQTPYRAGDEVYVDFALVDGRLMIRRVFENRTAPADGVVLDEKLRELDWDGGAVRQGLAVSRELTEGRWAVTVTGNGALELGRLGPLDDPALAAAPFVEPGEPLDEDPRVEIDSIGFFEVLRRLLD